MLKTKIITDSACDIPQETKLDNVEILNFHIAIDNNEYEERVDFTAKEFYKILDECEGIPSTAHITMMRFCEKYCELDKQGVTDVIHVTINKTGSATYDAAVMAKDMFISENSNSKMNITILDSACYSMGYGYPIICADKMINDGVTPDKIIEYLLARFDKTEILLGTYTLKFMKKSGRISAAAAFAGEIMGFRPVILMKKGKTEVLQKVRGDKMLIPAMVEHLKELNGNYEDYVVGYTDDDTGNQAIEACTNAMGYPPKACFYLGSAVSINAGPHSIGIIYLTR